MVDRAGILEVGKEAENRQSEKYGQKPHFIPTRAGMGKTVLTAATMNEANISRTEGHTQPLFFDSLKVARRTGTNISPAKINRRR